MHDDKLLIGKSSLESEDYNTLVFCFRDVIKVTIPGFIEVVGQFASLKAAKIFKKLKFPMIRNWEQLKITALQCLPLLNWIGQKAFSSSGIQRLNIPENSELHEIEEGAFEITSHEELTIPANLTELKEDGATKRET